MALFRQSIAWTMTQLKKKYFIELIISKDNKFIFFCDHFLSYVTVHANERNDYWDTSFALENKVKQIYLQNV